MCIVFIYRATVSLSFICMCVFCLNFLTYKSTRKWKLLFLFIFNVKDTNYFLIQWLYSSISMLMMSDYQKKIVLLYGGPCWYFIVCWSFFTLFIFFFFLCYIFSLSVIFAMLSVVWTWNFIRSVLTFFFQFLIKKNETDTTDNFLFNKITLSYFTLVDRIYSVFPHRYNSDSFFKFVVFCLVVWNLKFVNF